MATNADVKGIEMSGTHKSESAAKHAANKKLNSVVVKFSDGTFDWFPQGHPIGENCNPDGHGQRFIKANNYTIIARYSFGKWSA